MEAVGRGIKLYKNGEGVSYSGPPGAMDAYLRQRLSHYRKDLWEIIDRFERICSMAGVSFLRIPDDLLLSELNLYVLFHADEGIAADFRMDAKVRGWNTVQ